VSWEQRMAERAAGRRLAEEVERHLVEVLADPLEPCDLPGEHGGTHSFTSDGVLFVVPCGDVIIWGLL
jgi:hypothetical protein